MPPRERLTVDTMVFRDYLEKRPGYGDALKLLELHRCGQVELAAASSGYLIDATNADTSTGERISGDLWKQLRALFKREGVSDTAYLAYPNVMVPGPDAYPGAYVEGLAEAWLYSRTGAATKEGGRTPQTGSTLRRMFWRDARCSSRTNPGLSRCAGGSISSTASM